VGPLQRGKRIQKRPAYTKRYQKRPAHIKKDLHI